MYKFSLLFTCITILASPAISDATIYRWTSQDGQVYFGDAPPANAQIEQQIIPPSRHKAAEGLRPGELNRLKQIKDREQLEAVEKSRNEKQHLKQKASAARKAESKIKSCTRYKNRIRKISSQLRSGCKAAKCARLNEQRREYKHKTSTLC